jgi:hypothetical protein
LYTYTLAARSPSDQNNISSSVHLILTLNVQSVNQQLSHSFFMIQHLFGQQEIDTAESSCQLGKTNMSFLLIALVLITAN